MTPDEDEGKVIVEEKEAVTVPPPAPARAAANTGFSWVPFSIISAIVAILGIVLIWLPSFRPLNRHADSSASTE